MMDKCKRICCKIWEIICWPFVKIHKWLKGN